MKKVLLTEGGAAGHMAHPFDLEYVKTGQDLLNFFTDKVPEYLKTNDPHIKTDGVNVSFKLVSKTNFYGEEKREFAVDRGSKKAIDIEGITLDRIGERFAEGHGMRPAITDLLTALNATLESGTIDEELKALGMWDNPDYFLNTEYVKEEDGKPVNVVAYGEDFIAFHGVNEFFMKPSPKGKSMSRKSKEVSPTKNSGAALASFTNKVRRYARGYMVYGPDDTKAGKREGTSINFDSALSEKVTVFLSEGTETTDTIGGWLRNPNTKNPFDATIVLADGRKMGAMSKHVYFSLVLEKVPVSELLGGTEGEKQQMAINAINGSVFYHATRLLGKAVLESLYASFGGHTADKHEGIVMRSKEAFGVTFPIKITGDFIYTGAGGTISQKMAKEEPTQVKADTKRKIAVFPGAFKPPHRGHMDVVEHFASVADQVVILISPLSRKTPAGKEINKSVSEKIWQIYIDAKGIGNKVSIGSSPYNSPVQASFEVLKGNVPDFVPQAGDLIIPVASDKPDKKGNPDYTRFLKFHEGLPDMIEGVIPANIEEFFYKAPSEGALSASAFRAALDTGEDLEAFLPTSVDPQKVLAVLGVEPEPEVEEPEIDEPEDSGAPPAIFMGEDLIRMVEGVLNEQGKESMAPGKKPPKPKLDTSSDPEWWPHQQGGVPEQRFSQAQEEVEVETGVPADIMKVLGALDPKAYEGDEEIEIVDDKELGIIRGDIWELAAQMGMPNPSDSLASEMDISKLEAMRTDLGEYFYNQQELAYEFVNQGLANLGIEPDVANKVCPGGSLDCLNGFGNAMSHNPEGGKFKGFSWEDQERDEEGHGVGDTGEDAGEPGDTGDTGYLQEKKKPSEASVKKAEKGLEKSARKKGFKKGSERWNKYVYGGKRKMGWKPERELEEEELDEISAMGAGAVEGGGNKKPLIIEEEPEVVEEVLNYLLGRMEIL